MNWSVLWTTFGLVFLAEIGDKTQLATITMVARTAAPGAVFVGATPALVAVTLVGVVGGTALTRVVSPSVLHKTAAIAFIAIGVWMLWAGED